MILGQPRKAAAHIRNMLRAAPALLVLLSAMAAAALDTEQVTRMLGEARRYYGNNAVARLAQWINLMQSSARLAEMDKLRLVNTFFNGLPNIEDKSHWGIEDYWSTPVEMLASNGGDCEDFALAKYFTLREMGVPDERLRITYVKAYLSATRQMQSHMVLTYYPAADAEPLVLDNIVDAVKPASERTDLLPTYSFNATGLWLAKERGAGRLGDTDVLPSWQDFNRRMLKAGLAR